MRASHFARLQRYAAFAVVHGLVVAVTLTGVLGSSAGVVLLVASLPLFWAWGAYQADLALNAHVGERDRQRWRLALWLVPWSMALYFHRHVRGREVF